MAIFSNLRSVTRSAGACAACRADRKALGEAAGTVARPTTSSISPRRRLYEPEARDQHPVSVHALHNV